MKLKLENFADGNKICADSKVIQALLGILEREYEMAISWFKKNEIIVNLSTVRSKQCG